MKTNSAYTAETKIRENSDVYPIFELREDLGKEIANYAPEEEGELKHFLGLISWAMPAWAEAIGDPPTPEQFRALLDCLTDEVDPKEKAMKIFIESQ